MLSALWLLLGLVLLIGGADLLVRGVSALARALGVSPLIIGMTVVSFGTSTPELVLGITSAVHGQTALTFGNIVGANTINIGVVLTVAALVRPLQVDLSIITREIPMMLLATAAALVLALDRPINGAEQNVLSRGDGVILLLLFGVFLYYTIAEVVRRRAGDPFVAQVERGEARVRWRSEAISALLTVAGLCAVAIGARLAVMGATQLALAMDVPPNVIGYTIVSLGTTLPELVTSIVAARKGQADIAIGNVVGSNIYNLLCIGGIVAVIRPVPLPQDGQLDLVMLAGLSAALLPVAIRGPRKITRAEGALLLTAYIAYAVWRVARVG